MTEPTTFVLRRQLALCLGGVVACAVAILILLILRPDGLNSVRRYMRIDDAYRVIHSPPISQHKPVSDKDAAEFLQRGLVCALSLDVQDFSFTLSRCLTRYFSSIGGDMLMAALADAKLIAAVKSDSETTLFTPKSVKLVERKIFPTSAGENMAGWVFDIDGVMSYRTRRPQSFLLRAIVVRKDLYTSSDPVMIYRIEQRQPSD